MFGMETQGMLLVEAQLRFWFFDAAQDAATNAAVPQLQLVQSPHTPSRSQAPGDSWGFRETRSVAFPS